MADIAGAMAAIEAFFRAGWAQTPVALPNENSFSIPVTGTGSPAPWLMLEIDNYEAGHVGAGAPGNHLIRDAGDIELTIFVSRGTGRDEAVALATAAGEVLRSKLFYRDDTRAAYVRTWVPRVGRGENAISDNPKGNWWAVTCTVPFEFYRLT